VCVVLADYKASMAGERSRAGDVIYSYQGQLSYSRAN